MEQTPELAEKIEEPAEDVKDTWDASSSEEEDSDDSPSATGMKFIQVFRY